MKIFKTFLLSAALLFCSIFIVRAQIKLPSILSNNMCLQQSAEVKIWGTDTPGQKIVINPSWSEPILTEADRNGNWLAVVTTPGTGETGSMDITGSTKESISNIIFGEVWLCSGQSNMERALGFRGGQKPIVGFYDTAKKAECQNIRFFNVAKTPTATPQDDCKGEWIVCTPETVLNFSAVGYYFGRILHDELDTPVGLIQSTWGGTPVEPWMPVEYYSQEQLDEIAEFERVYETENNQYNKELEEFKTGKREQAPQATSSINYHLRTHFKRAVLYNGMISPIVNYTIKGAIWYQGESNVPNSQEYKIRFPKMIQAWRDRWNIGDFPFYFVQIAPFLYTAVENGQPKIVEAQCEALKMANVGIAATQDIGSLYDIHPVEKKEVGRRLSLIALNQTYNKKDVVYSAPVLKSQRVEQDNLILEFDLMGSKMHSMAAAMGGIYSFFIAGDDKIFYEATPKLVDDKIIINSPNVENPVAVRYNWSYNANASLFNTEGLPVIPFRTDDWNDATYAK